MYIKYITGTVQAFVLALLFTLALPQIAIHCTNMQMYCCFGKQIPMRSAYYSPAFTNTTSHPLMLTLLLKEERPWTIFNRRINSILVATGRDMDFSASTFIAPNETKTLSLAVQNRIANAQLLLLINYKQNERVLSSIALLDSNYVGYSGFNLKPNVEICITEEMLALPCEDNCMTIRIIDSNVK